jgi:acetyl esterase/lipase
MVLSLFASTIIPALALTQSMTQEPGIRIIHDIAYTPAGVASQALDLYLPTQTPSRPLPLIILIHGGGWLGGDKLDNHGLSAEFVRRGFAVASPNYHESNEAIWPAQAIDCKSVVRWLRAHSEKLHLDPDRFAVGGHSAGGHLSAFLAASNGVKTFDKGANLDVSSDVQAELWFSGVADLVTRAETPGYEIVQNKISDQSRLIGGPALENRELAMQASPVSWVSKKSAPFFFEHGTADKQVPPAQVNEMAAALTKNGIYSEAYFLKGVGHAGPELFDKEHLDLMDKFLRKVLHLDSSEPVK